MLRITVSNELETTRFKLEGKLAHKWVAEAKRAWIAWLELRTESKLLIDLCDVSFVDGPGEQLLSEMHRAGASLVGSSPMIKALIEGIAVGTQSSRVKPSAFAVYSRCCLDCS